MKTNMNTTNQQQTDSRTVASEAPKQLTCERCGSKTDGGAWIGFVYVGAECLTQEDKEYIEEAPQIEECAPAPEWLAQQLIAANLFCSKLQQDRDELLAALKLVNAFLEDLSGSNPGYLGKLTLQDYGQFNDAMIAMNRAINIAKVKKVV